MISAILALLLPYAVAQALDLTIDQGIPGSNINMSEIQSQQFNELVNASTKVYAGTLISQSTYNLKYSFLARIGKRNGPVCSGFMITSRWGMSAKHCLINDKGKRADFSKISFGARSDSAKTHSVNNWQDNNNDNTRNTDFILHPSLDVMFFKLNKNHDGSTVRMHELQQSPGLVIDKTLVYVLGWGNKLKTASNSISLPMQLMGAIMQVASNSNGIIKVKSTNRNRGYCQGDSGGPLLTLDASNTPTAYGVVSSMAPGCVDPNWRGNVISNTKTRNFIRQHFRRLNGVVVKK